MQNEIRQDKIVGSRRFSNYFWSFFLFLGGVGFLFAGLSSYFKINFLPFTNPTELVFIPQGLIMMFYGTLSFGISIYIIFTIFLDIGSGYNEYNKIENLIKIVRKGFPGKKPGNPINLFSIKCSSNWNKNNRRIKPNSKYLFMFKR